MEGNHHNSPITPKIKLKPLHIHPFLSSLLPPLPLSHCFCSTALFSMNLKQNIFNWLKSFYPNMLELTLSSANFQLRHRAPNCCCSEHIVLHYMAVSFGAPCFSTHIVSLTLRIMMFSDNCYNNLDGVVHLNSLCLIMCLHFLLYA